MSALIEAALAWSVVGVGFRVGVVLIHQGAGGAGVRGQR